MATIELSQSDNGATRNATIGNEIEVTLEEIATSGYRWSVEEVDVAVLHQADDLYEPPQSGRPGASGVRRYRFRVVGAGTSPIRLALARSWDPAARAGSFEVTIVAAEAGG